MKCDKHPDYGPLIMCSGCKDEQNTLRMRQAERIKELEHQLSCRTDKLSFRGNTVSYIYDKAKCYGNQLALAGKILSEHNLMDEFEERWNRVGSTKELSELQLAEQIGVLSASLELALNQQKIDRAENQRLKEALQSIMTYTRLGVGSVRRIRQVAGKALAAQPQKESEE